MTLPLKSITIENIAKTKGKEYYSIFLKYFAFVEKNYDCADNIENLFKILRSLGYLYFMGIEFSDDSLRKIAQLFNSLNSKPGIYTKSQDIIDFDELYIKRDQYEDLINSQEIQHPPIWTKDPQKEIEWENSFNEVKEIGMELIISETDVQAIIVAYNILNKLNQIDSNDAWHDTWDEFLKQSNEFTNSLINNLSDYYYLSDNIEKLFHKFPFIDVYSETKDVHDFLYKIITPSVDYANKHFYRYCISQQEAQEIYGNTDNNYSEDLSASFPYYLEVAIAMHVLKKFILKTCQAKEIENKSLKKTEQLSTNLDSQIKHNAAMIFAGDKQYNLYVSNLRLKQWDFPNDHTTDLLLQIKTSKNDGAVFCSWKKYSDGSILVRFDSYMLEESFKKVIQQSNSNKNFTFLTYDHIFQPSTRDCREIFLEKVASAILSPELAPETPIEKIIKLVNEFKNSIIDNIDYRTDFLRSQSIVVAGKSPKEAISLKNINRQAIQNEKNWKGIFRSIRDESIIEILQKNARLFKKTYFVNWMVIKKDSTIKRPETIEEFNRKTYKNVSQINNIDDKDKNKWVFVFVGISDDDVLLQKLFDNLENTMQSGIVNDINSILSKDENKNKNIKWIIYKFDFNLNPKN